MALKTGRLDANKNVRYTFIIPQLYLIKLKKSGRGVRERKIKQRENMVYHYFAYIKLSIHSTNQSVIETLKSYCARLV